MAVTANERDRILSLRDRLMWVHRAKLTVNRLRLTTGRLKPPERAALASLLFDMEYDEFLLISAIDDALVGRPHTVSMNASIDEDLRSLLAQGSSEPGWETIFKRREVVLRLALDVVAAGAGALNYARRSTEHYEHLFALSGDPPSIDALISTLKERSVDLRIAESFGTVETRLGWAQVLLIDAKDQAIFVEVHRPGARWEGSLVRGTVRAQIDRLLSTIDDAKDRRTLRSMLVGTRFIIGVSTLGSDPLPAAIPAIREHFVTVHNAIAQVNGQLVES